MLDFSKQMQAAGNNSNTNGAGTQSNASVYVKPQSQFNAYSPSKGYNHELNQVFEYYTDYQH